MINRERFRNRVVIPAAAIGALVIGVAAAPHIGSQDKGCYTTEIKKGGDVADAVTQAAAALELPVNADPDLNNAIMSAASTANEHAPDGRVYPGQSVTSCFTAHPTDIFRGTWDVNTTVLPM